MEKPTMVLAKKITADYSVRQRSDPDQNAPHEIAEVLRRKDSVESLDVFFDGDRYWLADGFYRYEAWKVFGSKSIPCTVHKGNRRDALLFACGANETHGWRRSRADLHKAIETVLADEEWKKRSNNWIAQVCRASDMTVAKLRKQLEIAKTCSKNEQVPKYEPEQKSNSGIEGRDGKVYPKIHEPAADTSEEPTVLTDDAGTVIPERLVDAFCSEFYQEAPGEIRALIKRLQPIGKWNPFLSAEITGHLKQAVELLEASEPALVATCCGGKGCSNCKRAGFVPKMAA